MNWFKNWAKALAIMASFSLVAQAFTVPTCVVSYPGSGAGSTTNLFCLDGSGNMTIKGGLNVNSIPINADGSFTSNGLSSVGGLLNGTPGVAVSTLTTLGNSIGTRWPVYLLGTIPAVEGSVLIASATTSAFSGVAVVVSTGVNNLTTVVGVASAPASTGSVVNMYTDGFVLALTTGTVNPGDVLVTTVTGSGYLAANNSPTSGTDVGVALSTGPSTSGLTRIRLNR